MMEACRIDADGLDARLWDARLTVLCDVDAPLAGPTGAVCLFAPQKGLKAEQVAPVEQAFAVRCRHACGAGAAGGIGFALMLLGATVESGAAYVMRACGFERQLRDADWVVTGEGRSDAQTLRGKLPARVAEAAAQRGVPTALISGDLDAAAIVPGRLFDAALAARPPGCPLAQAKADALSLLRRAAAAWAASVSGRD
jgi:glycerate kinase